MKKRIEKRYVIPGILTVSMFAIINVIGYQLGNKAGSNIWFFDGSVTLLAKILFFPFFFLYNIGKMEISILSHIIGLIYTMLWFIFPSYLYFGFVRLIYLHKYRTIKHFPWQMVLMMLLVFSLISLTSSFWLLTNQ